MDRPADQLLGFSTECINSVVESYLPIVERRKDAPFTDEQKSWQQLRRGRYVEFNLVRLPSPGSQHVGSRITWFGAGVLSSFLQCCFCTIGARGLNAMFSLLSKCCSCITSLFSKRLLGVLCGLSCSYASSLCHQQCSHLKPSSLM